MERIKMPLKDRAKQFMPFDTLKGLQDALRLKEYKHERIEMGDLAEDKILEISNTLSNIKKYDYVEIKIYEDGYIKTFEGKISLQLDNNQITVDENKFSLNTLIDIKIMNKSIN